MRGLSENAYAEAVERRRAFHLPGYKTLAEVGFDGPWVTPLQQEARSLTGTVIIGFNWLDVPSVEHHRDILARRGYLPNIPFNRVLDAALSLRGLTRADVYLSQAFHLLPERRSGPVSSHAVQASFDAITRFEIGDRPVVTLGEAAARACRRAAVDCLAVSHPSARGFSFEERAKAIAAVLPRA